MAIDLRAACVADKVFEMPKDEAVRWVQAYINETRAGQGCCLRAGIWPRAGMEQIAHLGFQILRISGFYRFSDDSFFKCLHLRLDDVSACQITSFQSFISFSLSHLEFGSQ